MRSNPLKDDDNHDDDDYDGSCCSLCSVLIRWKTFLAMSMLSISINRETKGRKCVFVHRPVTVLSSELF